jgi:hypothetical protein
MTNCNIQNSKLSYELLISSGILSLGIEIWILFVICHLIIWDFRSASYQLNVVVLFSYPVIPAESVPYTGWNATRFVKGSPCGAERLISALHKGIPVSR